MSKMTPRLRSAGLGALLALIAASCGECCLNMPDGERLCLEDPDPNPVDTHYGATPLGNLSIGVYTDGAEPLDWDGYTAVVDGTPHRLSEVDDPDHLLHHWKKIQNLDSGEHTVELQGVSETNCELAGEAVQTATVGRGGATTDVLFEVTCYENAGSLRISTSTSGTNPDADGYGYSFGAESGTIGPDDSLLFEGVATGDYTVELTGIADNCAVMGDNPLAVTVAVNEQTRANFAIMCYEVAPLPQVFIDHFNDGELDPAWEVSLTNATDWVYSEAGTWLTVTDIVADVPPDPNCATTAQVTLDRSFAPLGDFTARFDFAWDSEEDLMAMQVMMLNLYTTEGARISAGYNDAWGQQTGELFAYAAGEVGRTGYSSLDHSGRSHALVSRIGDALEISFDGETLLTYTIDTPVERAQLMFRFHNCMSVGGAAFFGTEEVDVVHLFGEAAP